MTISAHFSVTTAGAIVLGGIAAIVLATIIALTAPQRHRRGSAPINSSHPGSSSSATPRPDATTVIEYQVDTGE